MHGINAIIERDALSLFLVQTYMSSYPLASRILRPETLPAELRDLLDKAQQLVGHDIWLIDITSDIGVPTTLAYVCGTKLNYVRGYGTSLSSKDSGS